MGDMYTHESDELCHYGALGIKWGVKRNPTKDYIKASKKRDRLNFIMSKKEELIKLF